MRNFVGQSFMFLREKTEYLAILYELLIEIYNQFEDTPDAKTARDIFYWYASDYCDVFLADRIREQIIAGRILRNRI